MCEEVSDHKSIDRREFLLSNRPVKSSSSVHSYKMIRTTLAREKLTFVTQAGENPSVVAKGFPLRLKLVTVHPLATAARQTECPTSPFPPITSNLLAVIFVDDTSRGRKRRPVSPLGKHLPCFGLSELGADVELSLLFPCTLLRDSSHLSLLSLVTSLLQLSPWLPPNSVRLSSKSNGDAELSPSLSMTKQKNTRC